MNAEDTNQDRSLRSSSRERTDSSRETEEFGGDPQPPRRGLRRFLLPAAIALVILGGVGWVVFNRIILPLILSSQIKPTPTQVQVANPHIPLRDSQPSLLTNWFELTITCNQTVIFQNSWISDHLSTDNNVTELFASGRARCQTENENHNVLKTKGYHIEHNFGHVKEHLASFLLTLNLLAFLFHTVLHLVDLSYQQIRSLLGTRKRFFNDLRTLTTYFVFDSWRHLISFMLDEFDPICPANSS